MKISALPFLTALILLFSGCSSPEFLDGNVARRMLPDTTGETGSRADEFKNALSGERVTGVFLKRTSLNFFSGVPDELAKRLAMLGVNAVYIEYDREFFTSADYQRMLEKLIPQLDAAGAKVFLELKMSDNLWYRSGNTFVRRWINPPHDVIDDVAENFARYQIRHPNAKFGGIFFSFNVEFFDAANSELPPGNLYGWSDLAYGPGRDNDLLVKNGFDTFAAIKEKLVKKNVIDGLIFGAAAPLFIPEQAASGGLTAGTVEQFASTFDFTAFDARKGASAEIGRAMAPMLDATTKKNAIGLILPLSNHAESGGPALRRRSFKQFMVGLQAVEKLCAKHQSFGGIVFDDFAALEDIWEK